MEIRKKLDTIVGSKSRLLKALAPQGRDLGRPKYSADIEHHCQRLTPE